MRSVLAAAVLVIGLAPAVPGQAQSPVAPKVQIAFDDSGRVSLAVNGATLREILAEWSRLGGSHFVDADRLTGGPMTVQYDQQPETEVIASLLRQAAGFVVGPRRAGSTAASQIEVVYILPTSRPTQGAFIAPPAQPTFQQPQVSTPGAPDDEIPPVQGGGRAGQPPAPGQTAAPPPGPQPAGTSGVAVPVTIIPVTIPPPTTGRGGRGGGGGGR